MTARPERPTGLVVAVALAALLLASPVAAQTWVIDPVTTVAGFAVRHLMVNTVTGVFETTRGTIEYTPGEPASLRAEVVIDARSLTTQHAKRDAHLKSDDFIHAEKFPALTFRSRRVQNVGPAGFELVGDLTIRDVTREVVLKVERPSEPTPEPDGSRRIRARATTAINRKEFNVMYSKLMDSGGVVVGDEVRITLDVQAVEKRL
jgi:polyisoprenoid-binding protein YceI